MVSGSGSWVDGGTPRGSRSGREKGENFILTCGHPLPRGICSVGSRVDGADTQEPGLGVLSLTYEILEDLCIHSKLHSRPDT